MPNRPLVIAALAGGVAIVVAIGVNVLQWEDETRDTSAKKQVAEKAKAKTSGATPGTAMALPSFDVVRIDPQGDAVMVSSQPPPERKGKRDERERTEAPERGERGRGRRP